MNKIYIAALILAFAISGIAIAVEYPSSPAPEFFVNTTAPDFDWNYKVGLNASLNTSYYNYTNVTIDNSTALRNSLGNGINFNTSTINVTLNTSAANSSTFVLTGLVNSSHPAGRYTGTMYIYNYTNNAGANISLSPVLDVPTYFNASRIATFTGNASSTNTGIFYFNSTNVSNTIGLEINLTGTSSSTAGITLFNSTGNGLGPTSYVNSTMSFTYVSSAYPLTTDYWYITVENSSVAGLLFNGTIEAKRPSLIVNNSFQTSTITLKDNVGYNKTITTGFWMNNSADYALVFNNITNSTNLAYGNYIIAMASNISTASLGSGTSRYVELNFTLNTSLTNNTPGIYNGWMLFNTSNGYPYNMFNLSLSLNLTSGLDVTVSDVRNNTQNSNWTYPNSTINITVTPKYANGTMVPGLVTGNFSAIISHVNGGVFTCDLELDNETMVVQGASHYNITAKIPATSSACSDDNDVLGGNYTVTVSVSDNRNSVVNSGSGTYNGNLTINDTALRMEGLIDGSIVTSLSKAVSTTFQVDPKVFNYGARAGTGVNVTQTSGSCVSLTGGPSTIYIGDVSAFNTGGATNSTPTRWTYTTSSTNGTCSITLTAEAAGTAWYAKTHTISVTVTKTSTTTTPPASSDASNQSTSKHELTITEYPSSLQITQGKTGSASVTVKNTGAYTEKVSLSIEGINSGWWTAPNSEDILKGSSKSFTISLNIPESAEVKSYSIKYKATSSSTSASADTTLKINPGNNTQTTILQNITNLTKTMESFEKEINDAKAAGYNVSAAESFLKAAKENLSKMKSYADVSDWFNSYSLIDDVKSALESANTSLSEAKKKTPGVSPSTAFIATVVAIAAIIGAIVYLIMPAGGKSAGGYAFGAHPMGKTNAHVLRNKLAEKLKNFKEKFKRKKKASSSSSQGYHYSG